MNDLPIHNGPRTADSRLRSAPAWFRYGIIAIATVAMCSCRTAQPRYRIADGAPASKDAIEIAPLHQQEEVEYLVSPETGMIAIADDAMGGAEAVIAREVKKGSETLVLRDKNGTPMWSGYRNY